MPRLETGGVRLGPDYRCDYCKAVLSDRGVGEDHIALPIAADGGRASCNGPLPGWRVVKRLRARWYHFCGPGCLARYFGAVLGFDEAPEYAELVG
jgi:hypothetical protein